MKEVITNVDLEKIKLPEYDISKLISRISKEPIVSKIGDGKVFHYDVINYLQQCWNYHKGVILTPDMVWHVIMYNISTIIKNDSEKYRDLFTTSNEKQMITVTKNDPYLIDVKEIIEQLKKVVPTSIEKYCLNFSTSTSMSKLAINTAFCDAVSPYYDYSMFLCGIPKIKIMGDIYDWKNMKDSLTLIGVELDIKDYSDRCISIIDKIIDADPIFLSQIFNLKKRGSGGQMYLNGWIKDLYLNNEIMKIECYGRTISSIDYKDLSSDKDYTLYSSLFTSTEENDYLIPEWGYIIENKK